MLILRDLLPGKKRCETEKGRAKSLSERLTAQLRDMESNGLVSRKVYPEVPPRVEYSLTELGQSLKPILDAMQDWGEEYKAKKRIKIPPAAAGLFHTLSCCSRFMKQVRLSCSAQKSILSHSMPGTENEHALLPHRPV